MDEIQVTGQTDQAACASIVISCPEINFNIAFNTKTAYLSDGEFFPTPPPNGGEKVQEITGLSGTLNNLAVSAPPGSTASGDSFLIFSTGRLGNVSAGQWLTEPGVADSVSFTLAGFPGQGLIGFEDMLVGGMEIVSPIGNSFVTWNSTVISTPEPSLWILLCAGLALLAVKRLISR